MVKGSRGGAGQRRVDLEPAKAAGVVEGRDRVGAMSGPAELVTLCDRSGRIVSIDPEAAAAWGVSDRLAVTGRSWESLGLPVPVSAAVGRGFARVAEVGRLAIEEVRVGTDAEDPAQPDWQLSPDTRIIECRVTPLPAGPEGCEYVVVVLRDVTEARRAEEAVRQRERQYRLIAENSSDMISLHDPAGAYLYVSPACRPLTGFEPEQLVGRSAYEFIHPDDLAEVHRVHSTLLATTDTFTLAFRGRRREGTYTWLETTTRAIREAGTGHVLEIQCSTRDISRRKQAEQELRENKELLQAVLDNCPGMVYIKDLSGRLMLINRQCERLSNMPRKTMVGRREAELFPPEVAAAFRANDLKVIESRKPLEFEETLPQDDGVHTFVSVKFPLFDRGGEPYAVCGISTDITARKRAEDALAGQSEVLRSILDNMADAVIVADEMERFLLFNPAAERMFGLGPTETTSAEWPERYGLFLTDGVTPFPAEDLPLTRAVRGEETNHVEMFVRHARRPEGSWVLINGRPLRDADGKPRGGVVVCRDITDRKTAEERLRLQNLRLQESAESEKHAHEALKHAEVQLVQAEKLTALGQMVAGVAHEINNPLAFVNNNVAVLQRDVCGLKLVLDAYRQADTIIAQHAPGSYATIKNQADQIDLAYTLESLERLTDRSREGLRRIQQIVKDLRDFARLDDGDLQEVDLNVGVTSTVNMIQGRAKKQDVVLVTDLHRLPAVTCYPGKINQVVMNLLSNAIDACLPGGKVTVRTEAAKGGDGVFVRVEDTGSGVDPVIREKIFDPFFTTKPIGQGTGLGLSISYGIVKAHGGKITVDSELGKGSQFTVWLPLVPQVPALPAP